MLWQDLRARREHKRLSTRFEGLSAQIVSPPREGAGIPFLARDLLSQAGRHDRRSRRFGVHLVEIR